MTFISRRSPWMVPRPAGPDDAAKPDEPVLKLALSAAWRPRALAASMAAALGRVPGGGPQVEVHGRIGRLLGSSEAWCAVLRSRGLAECETLVQARIAAEPVPTCASWAEVAVADATFGLALEAAYGDLAGSADAELAAAARDAGPAPAIDGSVLADLASDAKNRDCLQILVDRWLPAAVQVFGRPGNASEPPLLESRIKRRASEKALAGFLDDLERKMQGLALWLPDAARMGVTAPQGWRPRRGAQ